MIREENTLLLRSNSRHDEFIILNPESGIYENIMEDDHVYKSSNCINGYYETINRRFVALYAYKGALFVRIDDQVIKIAAGVDILLKGNPENRTLVLNKNNIESILVNYSVQDWEIEGDPTSHIEEEDFDFGLFIVNVVSHPERIKVLLGVWGKK